MTTLRSSDTFATHRFGIGHSASGILRDVSVDDFLERVFVRQSDDLLDHLSALEQQQRRDPSDAELECRIRVLVDVQLPDDHLAVVVLRELIDRGGQTLAGTAPFCPEINEYRCSAGDRLLEVAVGQGLHFF